MKKKVTINLPNIVTFSRFIFGFVVLYLLLKGNAVWSAIFYFIGASTDMLDGQLARRLNEKTKLGGFLDALADRVFVFLVIIGLVFSGNLNHLIKLIFIFWVIGELVLGIMITKKMHKFWLFAIHRNSIRLTAFMAFIAIGWAIAQLPYLEIFFWVIMALMIFTAVDYTMWFFDKKWKAYENLELRLKKSKLWVLLN